MKDLIGDYYYLIIVQLACLIERKRELAMLRLIKINTSLQLAI